MKCLTPYIFCVAGAISLINCGQDTNVDPIPFISLESISSVDVTEFIDSITIVVSYSDEDGDLGFSDPDSNSLIVKDERLSKADKYYVPLLAPEGSGVRITGNINIQLRNTFLIGSGAEEMTSFRIRIKDRAGNWSNEISTPVVTIRK